MQKLEITFSDDVLAVINVVLLELPKQRDGDGKKIAYLTTENINFACFVRVFLFFEHYQLHAPTTPGLGNNINTVLLLIIGLLLMVLILSKLLF